MSLSRRAFLKLMPPAAAGALSLSRSGIGGAQAGPEPWPVDVPLGRVTVTRTRLYARPTAESKSAGFKYFDDVVLLLRQVVGEGILPHNHVWTETPDGFLYSSWVQPVFNRPNAPVTPGDKEGVWFELSVPYTDARTRPSPDAPLSYRLYYSSVYRVKARIDKPEAPWYEIDDENGYRLFAPAEALRPIARDETTPISPGVEDKRIRVSLGRQTLSAYEGETEVFRCQVASGTTYFGADGLAHGGITPAGSYPIWSKRTSRHMEGGTLEEGYDLPGVGWANYFSSNGAAIHSAYWHNDFGTPKSHGCLNARPADAKWLFRWTRPEVDYNSGVITVQWPGGTRVIVEE